MEEKELKEALESIKAVKEMLKGTSRHLHMLWQTFLGVGLSVLLSYAVFQVLVWKNLVKLFWVPWVMLCVLAILSTLLPAIPVMHRKKEKIKIKITFGQFLGPVVFFALLVASFIEFLPENLNPIPLDRIYSIWIIAYAFILFTIGKYLSLKSFLLSGVVILAGIPLAAAFPHYQYLISGIFLGLSLVIPSAIELIRSKE